MCLKAHSASFSSESSPASDTGYWRILILACSSLLSVELKACKITKDEVPFRTKGSPRPCASTFIFGCKGQRN